MQGRIRGALVVLSILFGLLAASCKEVVKLTYESKGHPDLYLDDPIRISCVTSGFNHLMKKEIVYNQSAAGEGCVTVFGPHDWGRIFIPHLNTIKGIVSTQVTDRYCYRWAEDTGFNLTLTLNLTDVNLRGAIHCRGQASLYPELIWDTLPINTIKVAPKNLGMTVSPQAVWENKSFTWRCQASDALPTSQYLYGLVNGSGDTISTNIYTPTKGDRDGFTITCTDMSHIYWRGGNTYKAVHILPSYIEIVGPTNIVVSLDSEKLHNLNCSKHVVGRPKLSVFMWIRGGEVLNTSIGKLNISVPYGGGVEQVQCFVQNEIGSNIIITWKISWTSKVPGHGKTLASYSMTIFLSFVAVLVAAFLAYAVSHGCRRVQRNAEPDGSETEALLSRQDRIRSVANEYADK